MKRLTEFHSAYSPLQSLFYDRVIAPATEAVGRRLLAGPISTLPADARVLDVGCGGGQTVAAIAAMRPDLRVVGAEPSDTLLRRAQRRRRGPTIRFERAEASHLPFDDGTFDLTISLFSIKHWPDPGAGLAECIRVTRPSGAVMLAEIDAAADRDRWRAFVDRTALPRGLRAAYTAATLRPIVGRGAHSAELLSLLEAAGLSDVSVHSVTDLAVVLAHATLSG